MDDFENELKSGFLEEVEQLLNDAEQCFLILESNPKDIGNLEKIFRIAHNIKGSSKAVGFDSLGAFTHEFESFLLKCKSGQIEITKGVISLLLKCNDHVRVSVQKLKVDYAAVLENDALIQEILNFKPNESNLTPHIPDEVSTLEFETLVAESLKSSTTEPIDLFAEAAKAFALAPVLVTPPTAPASAPTVGSTADESIRVSLNRLEKLLNFVGELVILQTVLNEQSYMGSPQVLRKTVHQLGKVTKEVQDISMSLRMVPLKQTFQKMQRIVRDTSSALGKKVNLILEGEETEVDKTVLEALSDPLVHLIRNAVDHGIESPEDRVAKGKIETGEVVLRAYHQGGRLVIEVRDNGGGIPAERLKQKAIEKGILRANQVITEKEAIHLIFHPGFSTKAQVTEVSGRGVGMDVVKTNIEQLQGEIQIETILGKGSIFKIFLPLTLAIIDGMIIRCGDEKFIIPLSHVHETVKVEATSVTYATRIGEVLFLRGENLPVVRLGKALGKQKRPNEQNEEIAIIVRNLSQPFAVFVDDVIGQHQVVIKKLGAEIQNLKGYTGSAILGDGKPALILELGELVSPNSSTRKQAA